MDVSSNCEFQFEQESKKEVNSPCSRYQQFENIAAPIAADTFFVDGWDSIMSMDSHQHTNHTSYDVLTLENQGITGVSHLVQQPPCIAFNKFDRKLSCLESQNYPEPVVPIRVCKEVNYGAKNQEEHPTISNNDIQGPSLIVKKRKRAPEGCNADQHYGLDSTQIAVAEQQKEVSLSGKEDLKKKDDKKQKNGQSSGAIAQKQANKQAKDLSGNTHSPKDDYIHVRAKRGQATNSHSLAERVRREKISERMKFLQDLVPGCNKITGKAVMLDEIINYVQSLQRQVEFLSMKLATLNPELNFDIESVLSKDILHSQGGGATFLGFCHGMTSSHHLYGLQLRGMHSNTNVHGRENSGHVSKATNAQFSSLPQIPHVWDELQGGVHVGFISGAPTDMLDMNG